MNLLSSTSNSSIRNLASKIGIKMSVPNVKILLPMGDILKVGHLDYIIP